MELHEAQVNIVRLSADLEALANELHTMSQRMYDLKNELFVWEVDQSDDIRNKERDGKLRLKDGQDVKLTDAVRLSLTQHGKKKLFAEYEALKRKRDVLKIAVQSKCSSLSGYQSIAGIFKKEMETLGYTQQV